MVKCQLQKAAGKKINHGGKMVCDVNIWRRRVSGRRLCKGKDLWWDLGVCEE